MRRKSPYRHPVRSHTRSGVKVGKYERGKGPKPKPPSRTHPSMQGGFTVSLYFDHESESHSVRAKTYVMALNAGLGMIQTSEIPDRIRIRRA